MGLFKNKDEAISRLGNLEGKIDIYEKLIEEQRSTIEHLREQINRTQEALIATQHPIAYRHLKDDEAAAQAPEIPEVFSAESRQRKDWQDKYLDSLEGPIFNSADEMIETLKMVGAPKTIEPKSLHGNSES